MGHTPGPWRWFTNETAGTMEPHMKFLVGADSQGFCHTVGLLEPTDTDNARLIAAAPDLLAALERIANSIAFVLPAVSKKQPKMAMALETIVDECDAAIAKAK